MLNGVFRSSDATLVLAALGGDESDPENDIGMKVLGRYGLTNAVGRVQGLAVRVASDVRPVYEVGRRYPIAVRPGLIGVTGSVQRLSINGALVSLLLGSAADKEPSEPAFAQPAFNIVATLKDASTATASMTLTVFGVRFAEWSFALPLDDVVLESATFHAARITVVETEPKA